MTRKRRKGVRKTVDNVNEIIGLALLKAELDVIDQK